MMAVDDDSKCQSFFEFSLFDGFHFIDSELCVPQDPIECVPFFPDFYDGLISTEELSSLCDFEEDIFMKSEEIKTQNNNPSTCCCDCNCICKLGMITTKKLRSKRKSSKQHGWSIRDFRVSRTGNILPEMNFVVSQESSRRRCTHCQIDKTPQWRIGPLGPKTLCNACGVRYKSGRLLPEYRPAASPTFDGTRHSNFHKRIMKKKAHLLS